MADDLESMYLASNYQNPYFANAGYATPPGVNVAAPPTAPPPPDATQGPTMPAGSARVNLPGWDASRTDNDPKQVFGQFAQNWIASGKPWGAEGVQAFLAQDPRWEMDPTSSPTDPHIRVKQDALNSWKPGTSVWQDVITDSGPGGANNPAFMNADGSGGAPGGPSGPGGFGSTPGGSQVPNFFAGPSPYQNLPLPDVLKNPYAAPTWTGGDFAGPTKPDVLNTPYALPSIDDLMKMPGYQVGLNEGLKGIQRSAAAKGNILNPGTVQALQRFGTDYAGTQYGNLVSEGLAARNQNVGEYQNDFTNAFNTYKNKYGMFTDYANRDLAGRQQNVGEYNTNNANNLNTYLTNYNIGRQSQQDYLNQLNKEEDRGLTATLGTK